MEFIEYFLPKENISRSTIISIISITGCTNNDSASIDPNANTKLVTFCSVIGYELIFFYPSIVHRLSRENICGSTPLTVIRIMKRANNSPVSVDSNAATKGITRCFITGFELRFLDPAICRSHKYVCRPTPLSIIIVTIRANDDSVFVYCNAPAKIITGLAVTGKKLDLLRPIPFRIPRKYVCRPAIGSFGGVSVCTNDNSISIDTHTMTKVIQPCSVIGHKFGFLYPIIICCIFHKDIGRPAPISIFIVIGCSHNHSIIVNSDSITKEVAP
mmetsp:Transcript_2635/g.5762  ORF Transcript_2635/g.5762 Transcript_2635/m.5762 type:complete len:272 (-) Transcript_2635:1126-1941(-)